MKIANAGLSFLIAATLENGLAFSPPPPATSTRVAPLAAVDEASAQALSDYMAKSHEEKLRAIKDVEAKKNAEIDVS
jgi:hypothetical protein